MAELSRIPELPTKRQDRSECIVLAATGLLGALFAVLAFQSVPSFEESFGRLGEAERHGIAAWQAILADAGSDKLTDAAVADRIEREVLPLWREARQQAVALETGPWATRVTPRFAEAFRRREEAWEAMVVAGRTGDPAQSRRAKAAWLEANRLVAELRRIPNPP